MTATLILGGARSGKSARALALAAGATEKVFIATTEPLDQEMAERIARHQRDRSPDFTIIEAPLELTAALRSACGPDRAVVVDCLTLWLSNLIHHGRPVEEEMAELCDAIRSVASAPDATLILISNEVGAGIVPGNALAREFRDAHGRLNQLVAAVSDRVELVTAGLPLVLKPARSQ